LLPIDECSQKLRNERLRERAIKAERKMGIVALFSGTLFATP